MISKFLNLDTDGTLSANSDSVVASQKAIKTYVDQKTAGGGGGSSGESMQYLFGNGSDGNVTLTADTSYDRMKSFENFTLNANVKLTKTTAGSPLVIRCSDTCTINGTINLQGKGFQSANYDAASGYCRVGDANIPLLGISPNVIKMASCSADLGLIEMLAATLNFGSIPWCGGSGAGSRVYHVYGKSDDIYTYPAGVGCSSGGSSAASTQGNASGTSDFPVSGGAGGGGLLIIARKIIIAGNINLNGTAGAYQHHSNGSVNIWAGSGGGGGGCAVLLGNDISIIGTISANGGAGGGGSATAGGTGGYVKLVI